VAAHPGGVDQETVERDAQRTHPKAGLALIQATINELLLSRAIAKVNGRLVAGREVAV
jgi:hypothetical protein